MPKNSPLNGKGKPQNGTQQATGYSPFPMPRSTSSNGMRPKISRVAPADASPRPDHENGGPVYWSGPICRETDAPVRIAADVFRLYETDVPPRMLQLKLLLDSARYTAQIYRKAHDKMEAVVRERRTTKSVALTEFCAEAAAVRAAQESIVAKPVAQMDKVIEEIAQADRVAVTLHAKPGVPPAAIFNATAVTTYQDTQQSQETSVRSESPSASSGNENRTVPTNRLARTKPSTLWTTVAMIFVGTLFGISVATERKILDFQAAKEFDSSASVWLVYAMALGAALVYLNHKAAFEAFFGGGESAAEEAPIHAPIINWTTLRHTIIPTVLVTILVSMEAVVTRNAYLASNWVSLPDPSNPLHYLSGLLFLLPTAGIGAMQGWRAGRKNKLRRKERVAAHEASTQKAEACEQKEEQVTLKLRDSEPAQWAQAWDTYLSKLHQRKAELMAEIARLSQPYENLIAQWEAAFLANPELTVDEVRILQATRVDAVAAYAKFMMELERLRLWQEGITQEPHRLHLSLTINQGVDSTLTPTAPVEVAKLSLWRRIVRFFRRLFGRSEEAVA